VIILPLLTFGVVFLGLFGLNSRRQDRWGGGRLSLLESAAFLGAYLAAFTEILSLLRLLTGPWSALCWGLALILAGWLGWRGGWLADGLHALLAHRPRPDGFDWAAGAILALILILLLVAALVSPSNNNDSLQYHMSRVMHWAQDRSLGFYATAYEAQLYNPIWAETVVLDLHLLWGSDRLANLVQWSSLLLALIGASLLAKLLGAGRRGQWAAAAFTAGLPMALLEATSTQNDLVTAFWLVDLLVFIVLSVRRRLYRDELIGLSGAFGLGLLTKGSFYPFATAPMVFFIVIQFRTDKPGRVILRGVTIGLIVAALNAGYWTRNTLVYGGPLGPASYFENKAVNFRNPARIPGVMLENILLNLSMPKDSLSSSMVRELTASFDSIGLHTLDGFTPQWGWNHEDLAGNPLQMIAIPLTLLLLILGWRRIDRGPVGAYLAVCIGVFVLMSVFIRIADVERRYQLPFFVAWAPLFGLAAAATGRKWLAPASVLLLLSVSFPWVLFNRTRPLIAMRPSSDPFTIPCLAGCTAGSVLNEPPVRVLFADWIDLQGPYADAAIRQSACSSVGLQLDSHDIEYAFWWLLDAPRSGIRLESISTYPQLERFIDPGFKPCAILCTVCRGKTSLHGLGLVSDYTGKVQLYMGPDFSPEPGQ